MKKGLLLSLLVCIGLHAAHGQNDFFFNHYMFNPAYFNPAWTGVENQAFVAAHHRTQWAGYSPTFDPGSAPTTQLVSLIVPVEGQFSGFGVNVVSDRQFGLRSNQIRFQASANKTLRSGVLHVGIAPSIHIQTIDPGDFRPSDPREDFGTRQSQLRPNVHIGAAYQMNNRLTVGLSVENLLASEFDLNGFEQLDYFERTVNLFATKEFGFTRDIVVRPSVLVRTTPENFTGYSFELSAIAEYQDKLWGGISFRRSESIGVLLGYSFLENGRLKTGYSFDYIIQNQDAKEPTSHEVFIRYGLPNLVFGGRKTVKTPRFAF